MYGLFATKGRQKIFEKQIEEQTEELESKFKALAEKHNLCHL